VASLSQGRTAAAQCGLFTHKSVPVIFESPCTFYRQFARAAFWPPMIYRFIFHFKSMTPRTGSLPIARPLPSPENPGKSEHK